MCDEPRALEGLLAEEELAWEAVVVDDGSPDPAAVTAVMASLADLRIRLLRSPANRGLGATLNAALDAATAPVVADHLAALLECQADPAVVLARSRLAEAADTPYEQLVRVAQRRTRDRWTERAELGSDDLDRLMWARVRAAGPASAAAACSSPLTQIGPI